MRREKLGADEILEGLGELPGWAEKDGKLVKTYKFDNFAESLVFVNRIGEIAERADHHPDITFGWGYADVATTTHDRGGVTPLDLALAREIEEITE